MPSNFTQNYQLSQWEATDQVCRTDFNSDNAKIDTVLRTLATGKGNCRIVTGSYTGRGGFGANNPNTLTFPFKPAVVIMSMGKDPAVLVAGITQHYQIYEFLRCYWNLTWTGNSVSWYLDRVDHLNGGIGPTGDIHQWNGAGLVYRYVVLGVADN